MNRFNMSWILFFLLIIPIASFAETDRNQEIRVHLSTSSPLQPIYVGKIRTNHADFDLSYLNQLEAILAYDLNYNGSTKVASRSPEKEQLLSSKNQSAWKDFG